MMNLVVFWPFLALWVNTRGLSQHHDHRTGSLGRHRLDATTNTRRRTTKFVPRSALLSTPSNSITSTTKQRGYLKKKSDPLWFQRIVVGSKNNQHNFIIWIDLENVRGKTGFAKSHEQVLELIKVWIQYYKLEHHVVVVADHGSVSQAMWDESRQLAIVFSGNHAKADDVIAKFVNLTFLQSPIHGHSVIVTADTELQSRCRRASKDNSYFILDPATFIEELEEIAAVVEQRRQRADEELSSSSSSSPSIVNAAANEASTVELSLQEKLRLGQLDEEIRLRAQILDVQVRLGRGPRKKMLTNKRRKKLQSQLDHLTSQLVTKFGGSSGSSILDQVTSLDDFDRGNIWGGVVDGQDSSASAASDSTLLEPSERDLILQRWKQVSTRASRKEQTGDRVVLAEQLRRQLLNGHCIQNVAPDEKLGNSPAKAFVRFFNLQMLGLEHTIVPDITDYSSEPQIVTETDVLEEQVLPTRTTSSRTTSSQELLHAEPTSHNSRENFDPLPITAAISDTHTFQQQIDHNINFLEEASTPLNMSTKVLLQSEPSRNPLKHLDELEIVAISDTHGFEGQLLRDISSDNGDISHGVTEILPHGDVLLHLGDFSAEGSSEMEAKGWTDLDAWLAKQPHPIKIVLRGNHDPWNLEFQQSGAWYITEPTTVALTESLSLGVIPFGSPRKLTASSGVPTKCDILATHVPPLKTLDRTVTGKSAGSGFLNRVVSSMGQHAPRLWLCGHIHEGRGVAERHFGAHSTMVINAANANRGRATHLDHGAVVLKIHKDPTDKVQILSMEDKSFAEKLALNDQFFLATRNRDASSTETIENMLLAVDLGLKSGVALFGRRGKLLRYEQFHFEKSSLDSSVKRLLAEWERELNEEQGGQKEQEEKNPSSARITHVAIEGADGYMLRAWADAALDLSILRVSPEEWRAELLLEKERTSGSSAKAASRLIARQVVEDFGAMPRHVGKFPTDVAEAVCLGLYVSHKLGWVERAGPVVRRYSNGNVIVPK